MVNVRFSVPCL